MTPIGDSRTRLVSTTTLFPITEWRIFGVHPATPAGPSYPLNWLGRVPRPLCRVHHPDLLQRLVLRMIASTFDPVQVECEFNFRRVQLLQTTVVEFGPEGNLRSYAWGFASHRPCLTPLPTSFVSALGIGHEGRWHSGFAMGMMAALWRLHHWRTIERSLVPTYVIWVMERLRSHLRDTIDLAPVHEAIRRALLSDPKADGRSSNRMGLDPHTLAKAEMLAFYSADASRPYATLSDYKECLTCLQNSD